MGELFILLGPFCAVWTGSFLMQDMY